MGEYCDCPKEMQGISEQGSKWRQLAAKEREKNIQFDSPTEM